MRTCGMQGNKQFTPKLFYQTSLEELVPEHNFYRRLNNVLNLHFLYAATEQFYGKEGQQSIDPVVWNIDQLLRNAQSKHQRHTSSQ